MCRMMRLYTIRSTDGLYMAVAFLVSTVDFLKKSSFRFWRLFSMYAGFFVSDAFSFAV